MIAQILEQYLSQFLTFVLVLSRISGLVLTAPLFGSRGAPMRVRSLLAVALSILITPSVWHNSIESPGNFILFSGFVAREVFLGVAMGLAVLILLAGLQVSGQIISQMGGLSLADVFDPGFDTNVPILSQLLDLTATAIFFTIGGHRFVLRALLDSFQWAPPGGDGFPTGIVDALTEIIDRSFSIGIRAAAPVMVSLLLAVVITGVISRALPQLNIMAIGFNVNALVLLAVLSATVGAAGWILQEEAVAALDLIRTAIRP